MLSLQLDGHPVDLSNDFSFTMNLKSPIFNDLGSYSYPFKIPYTFRNAIISGFRHRIESSSDPYHAFLGSFRWKNTNLFSGSVLLKILDKKNFEGTIYEGNGDFYYQVKNKTLQMVDFGKLEFGSETERMFYVNGCRESYYPDKPAGFPMIYNPDYFDPPTSDPKQMFLNNYDSGLIKTFTDGTMTNRTVIVPMLYLRFVLDKIFEFLQFSLEDSFFDRHPVFNRMVMYNSVDCNGGAGGFFAYPENQLLFNYHVPQGPIIDLLTGLENYLNIRFLVNNSTKTVRIISLAEMIQSPDYVDFSHKLISQQTNLEEKIKGFLLEMKTDPGDEEIQAISDYDDSVIQSIKDPVETISDLPAWPGSVNGEIRYVKDRSSYYKMTSQTWGSINATDISLHVKFLYQQNDKKIETSFSFLSDWRLENQVRCKNKQKDWREITPRVCLMDSLYTQGNFYSMVGKVTLDDYSLMYRGEYGLFNRFFKSFLDFRQTTRLVKISLAMNFNDIAFFDFSRKIMVHGVKLFVKSIQVQLKEKEIKTAVLECYQA